jgi:hypothetical protein
MTLDDGGYELVLEQDQVFSEDPTTVVENLTEAPNQLQALVIEKEEIIAAREETIHHREDQINESGAMITQRNTIIEFLQEQIHDLILEVDDAHAQINELQQQPMPPAAPAPKEEEDLEEIEGVSEIDSEHGDPVISPHHSSSGSQSSVGNLDDF